MGSLGEPDGGWPKQLQKIILHGAKPQRGRPGAHLPPVDLEETAAAVEKKIGRKPLHDEVLSYLMYPDVFLKFARDRQNWGDVDVLPTPQFYYGMERGSDIAVELEPGKALVIKFLTVGEPHPDGTRTVFFELNGQPREVTIRDRKLEVTRAGEAEGRSGSARPDRRADSGRGVDGRGGAESEAEEGRPSAGDGSDEDAEHGVCAGRGHGDAVAGDARASRWRRRICCW